MGGLSSQSFSLQLSSLQILNLLGTVSGRISSTLKTTPVVLGLNQPIVSVLMALASHQAQAQTQEDPAVEAALQPALVLMALSSLQTKKVSWRKFARRSSTQRRIHVVPETNQMFVLARMEPNSLQVDRTSSTNFRRGPFLAKNHIQNKMIHFWIKRNSEFCNCWI